MATHFARYKNSIVVLCKCPVCGKNHFVKMLRAPNVKPRIYCKAHEHYRYDDGGDYAYEGGQKRKREAR